MKIILCHTGSLGETGMKNAIVDTGYELLYFTEEYKDFDYDTEYMNKLIHFIQANPDTSCVISINYIPIISRATKPFKLPYISLTVDCPYSQLYSKTVAYPHNRIFLFDKLQIEKFQSLNPGNIFHLPLATEVDTWDKVVVTDEDMKTYGGDVTFVGSLYQEKGNYNRIKDRLPAEILGYVDGLVAAQANVFGYNFIEDAITEEWAENFRKLADLNVVGEDYIYDIKGVISDLYIGYKCSEHERIKTLQAVSAYFNTDLYTLSDTSKLPHINNRGPADSLTMMPKIFKCSKINLNITHRGIKSGIPLRVFDILGCGGFLISNYQPEILDYFTPDEDLVLYESIPDLINKIDYYLAHEEERLKIAENGYKKVKQYHTYSSRLALMLEASLSI